MVYREKLRGPAAAQVIDEMDRLMRQAYQDWLPFVTAAASRPPARSSSGGAASAAPALGSRVLKFVASATLTRDPSKIERLGLHCPRCIALGSADHRQASSHCDTPSDSRAMEL